MFSFGTNIESNIMSISRKGSKLKNEFKNSSFSPMISLAQFSHKFKCFDFSLTVSVYETFTSVEAHLSHFFFMIFFG